MLLEQEERSHEAPTRDNKPQIRSRREPHGQPNGCKRAAPAPQISPARGGHFAHHHASPTIAGLTARPTGRKNSLRTTAEAEDVVQENLCPGHSTASDGFAATPFSRRTCCRRIRHQRGLWAPRRRQRAKTVEWSRASLGPAEEARIHQFRLPPCGDRSEPIRKIHGPT